MFTHSALISLGPLSDVLEGKGTILHVMKFNRFDGGRFTIEATATLNVYRLTPPKDHEGFIIPMTSPFDKTPLETLITCTDFKLKKILVATTTYTIPKSIEVRHEMEGSFITERFSGALPTLSGCAQLLPLSDAEKLICHINGIAFE